MRKKKWNYEVMNIALFICKLYQNDLYFTTNPGNGMIFHFYECIMYISIQMEKMSQKF